jgi:cell division protein FtsB
MTGIDASAPRPPRPVARVRVTLPASRGGLAWLLVLVLVGGFVVFGIGRQVYASWAIGQEAEQIRDQIAAVQEENARYQAELDYLQSDAFISAEARRLRNLGRTGEHLLIIPPGNAVAPPQAATGEGEAAPPLLEQWLELFFGS